MYSCKIISRFRGYPETDEIKCADDATVSYP